MECRFEDRLAGRALRLKGFCSRIEARAAAEVERGLSKIETSAVARLRLESKGSRNRMRGIDRQFLNWRKQKPTLPSQLTPTCDSKYFG